MRRPAPRRRADAEATLPMPFSYCVRATLPDASALEEWIDWMKTEHLCEVLAAGALRGAVVRLDGDPPRAEARYEFADRKGYETYLHLHAPRLRARGLERFPWERGVSYERSCGEIVVILEGRTAT